jgi:hypothetical protein
MAAAVRMAEVDKRDSVVELSKYPLFKHVAGVNKAIEEYYRQCLSLDIELSRDPQCYCACKDRAVWPWDCFPQIKACSHG